MATLLHSESKSLYSWWWDSHISPKNSKWLQENLTDMDAKVKSMIRLIEEDADSFARRAEMYYKKRPELMKLVEEFYRAYRALAERYTHATGELRHAHRTIAKAFPDQEPSELVGDSPSKSLAQGREPYMPETKFPVCALFDRDDLLDDAQGPSDSDAHAINKGPSREDSLERIRRRVLKELRERFGEKEALARSSKSAEGRVRKGLQQEKEEERFRDEVLQFSNEVQNLKDKVLQETERADKAKSEVQGFKKALANVQAEKEDVLLQYQECLAKLSNIEGELHNAQKDSMRFNEKCSRAEMEVQTLKEALTQLETEKNAGLIKQMEYLEKVSHLESMLSQVQEDTKGLNVRATEAESDAQTLKDEISRLGQEKEFVLHQYNQCLQKNSVLESAISAMENEMRMLKKDAERAEDEVSELKKSLADLNKEKEALALQYKCCWETTSQLKKDVSSSKKDVKCLNDDLLLGTLKLKNAEEKCNLLEMSNLSLQAEADELARMIAVKDKELSEKQKEMENCQSCLQDERLFHAQVEEKLQTLQSLHSQSQDDQRTLEQELEEMLQMLKDFEASKHGLEKEIQQVRDENQSSSQRTLSSALSVENMQNEILNLREIKERLEKEVSHRADLSNSLQQEILCLKGEIKGLDGSYQAMVDQVEEAGLNPECLKTLMKSLQGDKSKLREIHEQGSNAKEILSKKLENMQELFKKKAVIESSLSKLRSELKTSQEKVNMLQESFQFLHGEEATPVADKARLLSQLWGITENMHKLMEKNSVLESSLSAAKVELEGLREKSKALEEICEFLKKERSDLFTERGALALKLENVERILENLVKRYMGLEEKYADMEKEKETVHCQVEELKVSLSGEKREWTSSQLQSETSLAGLENQIHFLQEESQWKKKEYEKELDKSLKAQFEISILKKFLKDVEEKNYSLIIECQKHEEASKLAEKLISELESDSLEQQVETELLMDEIERLRLSIYQVFRALERGPECAPKDKFENEQTFVHHILGVIEDMKFFISKHEEDKEQLLIENSVILTLLEQLKSQGMEIKSQKIYLEQEFKTMAENLAVAKYENDELQELNRRLKSDVSESHQHAATLEAELESLYTKLADLHRSYKLLEEAQMQVNHYNKNLLKKFSDLKEEKYRVDQHSDAALLECLATANQSEIFRSLGEEKLKEVESLLGDLNRQHEVNSSLEQEMMILTERLELQKAENYLFKDAVCNLEGEMQGIREYNIHVKKDILSGKESLLQTEGKLLDTELKLEAAENLNVKLCQTVAELKTSIQESLQIRENPEKSIRHLSENNSIQTQEIERLHIVNTSLESELSLLREEIEGIMTREQTLSSELQEKNNELELQEAEATISYFDLQVSSIHEVLFKEKVLELTEVCWTIENENASRRSEMERMKEKTCLMESEISSLKSQLCAYDPVISALRDDITFLEHNALLQTKPKVSHHEESESLEAASDTNTSASEILPRDRTLVSLQNLQRRIKAVGKLIEEKNKRAFHRRSNSSSKQESDMGEIERLKPIHRAVRDKYEYSRRKGYENELRDTPKLQKIKTNDSEVQYTMLMKDIPLDQASDSSRHRVCKRGSVRADDRLLELWETAADGSRDLTIGESLKMSYRTTDKDIVYDQFENTKHKSSPPSTYSEVEKELGVDTLQVSARSVEPNREVHGRRILERLASDAHKLENLQITVKNLRRKLETSKKSRKTKKIDVETVEEQIKEAEETIARLVDLNGQLVKNIGECPSPNGKASPQMKEAIRTRRRKVAEQARKGSERIDRLQLELQKIQYILLKLEDEKKSKVRNKFFRTKTIVLRDFIYNGRKNSGKRKKGPLCGCFRPSSRRNGRSP